MEQKKLKEKEKFIFESLESLFLLKKVLKVRILEVILNLFKEVEIITTTTSDVTTTTQTTSSTTTTTRTTTTTTTTAVTTTTSTTTTESITSTTAALTTTTSAAQDRNAVLIADLQTDVDVSNLRVVKPILKT